MKSLADLIKEDVGTVQNGLSEPSKALNAIGIEAESLLSNSPKSNNASIDDIIKAIESDISEENSQQIELAEIISHVRNFFEEEELETEKKEKGSNSNANNAQLESDINNAPDQFEAPTAANLLAVNASDTEMSLSLGEALTASFSNNPYFNKIFSSFSALNSEEFELGKISLNTGNTNNDNESGESLGKFDENIAKYAEYKQDYIIDEEITIFRGYNWVDDFIVGNDLLNVIRTYSGDDVIFGEGGRDHLFGGRGDDYLYGGIGWDILWGGYGEDTLIGGSGIDRLVGGPGQDNLYGGGISTNDGTKDIFTMHEVGFGEADIIHDFEKGIDKINIVELLTGYDPLNDAIEDFVALSLDLDGNSTISVDLEGANNFVDVFIVNNTSWDNLNDFINTTALIG